MRAYFIGGNKDGDIEHLEDEIVHVKSRDESSICDYFRVMTLGFKSIFKEKNVHSNKK